MRWSTSACYGVDGFALEAALLGDRWGAFAFGWHLILDFGNEKLGGSGFWRMAGGFPTLPTLHS